MQEDTHTHTLKQNKKVKIICHFWASIKFGKWCLRISTALSATLYLFLRIVRAVHWFILWLMYEYHQIKALEICINRKKSLMETQGFLQNSFREMCFFDVFISDVAELFLCVHTHTDMCGCAPPSPVSVPLLKLYLFHPYTWGEKKIQQEKKWKENLFKKNKKKKEKRKS